MEWKDCVTLMVSVPISSYPGERYRKHICIKYKQINRCANVIINICSLFFLFSFLIFHTKISASFSQFHLKKTFPTDNWFYLILIF